MGKVNIVFIFSAKVNSVIAPPKCNIYSMLVEAVESCVDVAQPVTVQMAQRYFNFFSSCSCKVSSDEVNARKRSKEIDRYLKESYKSIHTLLLLGAGESGKSTIMKQMQILHTEGFSEEERKKKINDIKDNIRDSILSIIKAMDNLSPPVKLENTNNRERIKWLQTHSCELSTEFFEQVEILWKDKGVKAAYERNDEFLITDNADYFLDRVHKIKEDDFLPDEQDILRCRDITKNINNIMFKIFDVHFRMIDVAGQRSERKKWFCCFNDITAVIFVAACSCYNLVLREDLNQNRLEESLELFRLVWNNRWLQKISVILFLNKQDLFAEKIIAGKIKLENYFPEFRSYHLDETERVEANEKFPSEQYEVIRGKFFIRKKFLEISEDSSKPQLKRKCYAHFTCAIDTRNIERIFNDCKEIIQRLHLERWGLL